ncbi:hypothetical protein MRY87_01680 [bacterium]|nr:hypothetical protein [bacterium]
MTHENIENIYDGYRYINERFRHYKNGWYEHSEALVWYWKRLPEDEQGPFEDILLDELFNHTRMRGIALFVLEQVGDERIVAELYRALYLCKTDDDLKEDLVAALLQMGQVTPELKKTVIKNAQQQTDSGLNNLMILYRTDSTVVDVLAELFVDHLEREGADVFRCLIQGILFDSSGKSSDYVIGLWRKIQQIDAPCGETFRRVARTLLAESVTKDTLKDAEIEQLLLLLS